MSGWLKREFAKSEFGPGVRTLVTAGEQIPVSVVVSIDSGNEATVASADAVAPVMGMLGVAVDSAIVQDAEDFYVATAGEVDVICATAVAAGDLVKVWVDGKVGPAMKSADAAQLIEDNVGLAFTNQPANDGVEVISSSTSDTQYLDIWGTTNGGVVVVRERILLTGTTAVSTTKVNWGVILGVEIPNGLGAAAVGTITVREASGNATITTITAGQRRSGVVVVPSAQQAAFLKAPFCYASGSSTKVVGAVGVDAAGDELNKAVTLAGADLVRLEGAFATVTKLLVGDLESSRTLSVKTSPFYDVKTIVGMAVDSAAADEAVTVRLMLPQALAHDEVSTDGVRVLEGSVTAAQLLTSFATPIDILVGPGDGKYFVVKAARSHWDYGSAAIVAGSSTGINLMNTGESIPLTTYYLLDATSMAATADKYHFSPGDYMSVDITGDGMSIASEGANPTSGGTGSVLNYSIWYEIVDNA